MKSHTLTFVFNPEMTHVVLVRPEIHEPDFHYGKWNGMTNAATETENLAKCAKKFLDELVVFKSDPKKFAVLTSRHWELHCYKIIADLKGVGGDYPGIRVHVWPITTVLQTDFRCLSHVPWLVGMARDTDENILCAVVHYDERKEGLIA